MQGLSFQENHHVQPHGFRGVGWRAALGRGGQHNCADSHPQICGLQGCLPGPWPRSPVRSLLGCKGVTGPEGGLQEAGSPNGIAVNTLPSVIPASSVDTA